MVAEDSVQQGGGAAGRQGAEGMIGAMIGLSFFTR
jgi:hypothetical protein